MKLSSSPYNSKITIDSDTATKVVKLLTIVGDNLLNFLPYAN